MSTILTAAAASIKRPNDAVAYAAGDIVSSGEGTNGIVVTGATNATPIVITATAHGLATGDEVFIAAVGGNTAANGKFTITKVDANSFSLNGSSGNAAYTSGGTVAKQLVLAKVARLNAQGGALTINSLSLTKTGGTATNAAFKVHLFNAAPTLADDNAALAVATGEAGSYLGTVALTLADLGGCCAAVANNLGITVQAAASKQNIYAVIEATAAYTPAAVEVFEVKIGVQKH